MAYTEYTAYTAAEAMETAFCARDFANVSHIIGSDWATGNYSTPEAYMNAAYRLADEKFGKLPWRYEKADAE